MPTKPFDLDKYIDEQDLAPFELTYKGENLSFPHFNSLEPDQAFAVVTRSPGDGDLKSLFAGLIGAELADTLFKMPLIAFNKVLDMWVDHAGVKSGESAASSSS